MKGLMRTEELYSSLQGEIYDNIIPIGHFDMIKVEDLPVEQGKAAEYLRRSYYKVSLVNGHSKIHYPGQSFEINGPALVFTHPNTPYKWERISKQQRGHICVFTAGFLSPLTKPEDFSVYQSADKSVIPLNETLSLKLERLFMEMSEELRGSYRQKYELLRNMLIEVFHQGQKSTAIDGEQRIGSNANERLTYQFLELMEGQFPIDNSAQKIMLTSPGAFAAKLFVHVNHLNKALHKVTGSSTSQLINQRLLLEAKNLLKGTRWTINEISAALGFDESNHFSTFFKRQEGINPAKFRSNID